MKRVVIVGGGITGLAAAHRLKQSQPACDIQLLEASERFGGTLLTHSREGFLLEGGPDCFLSEKPRGAQLCDELGLYDQLITTEAANRRSFIVQRGKLVPIPEGFYLIAPARLRPFLTSPLLSWPAKWRVLAEALIPARRSPPLKKGGQGGFGRRAKSLPTSLFQREELNNHSENDESLASFVRRRLGQDTLDSLAQPLLAGIYAADPETLSLKATFPQFLEMEQKYGSVLVGLKNRDKATQTASGARYSLFVTLKSGMQSLSDALEAKLGSILRPNTPVQSVRRAADGRTWDVALQNGETISCDGVCLALPAYRSAELLEAENSLLMDLLSSIPYSGSATLQFAYQESDIRHPLDGFGFVTPHKENRPTLACTFVHRKFPGRVPRGRALLRAFVGGALQQDLLQLTDAELIRRVEEDLQRLLGITRPPIFSQIKRWPRAMPQYVLGHVQRLLQIEDIVVGMRGLTLAGNWLRGVGLPDCIQSGEQAADRLIDFLNG